MKKFGFDRLALCIVILLLVGYVLATNPVLALVFVLVVSGCGTLTLVVFGIARGIRGFKRKISATVMSYRQEKWISPSQVGKLLRKVKRLELLLLDRTPEQEHARRERYHGAELPKLQVPFANVALYHEFKGLTSWLTFCGFPEALELTQQEHAFLSEYLDILEHRFQQRAQKQQKQQKQVRQSLNTLMQKCEAHKQTRMTIPQCEEYNRLAAGIDVLAKMVDDPACPLDLTQDYLREYQHDMESLLLQVQDLHPVC